MDVRRGILILVGSTGLCACGLADDSYFDDSELVFRTDGGVATRGGDWIANGLEDPNVSGVDPEHALDTSAGLSDDFGLLTDPDLASTAKYLVECALPAGRSITKIVDGEAVVLDGLIGLAPEWEDGACDEDCQEWVSACLLARTNVSGQTVYIWLEGDHEALGWSTPNGAVLEGGFYGNLFVDPEGQYLCKGSALDVVAAQREGRTCSMGAGQECDFTTYANCTSLSRCTLDGPNDDVPSNCKSGALATSAPHHTIATYVLPAS